LLKGLIAGGIGMFLACVGIDPLSGKQRLTFGSVTFTGGMDVIPVLMGLFGVAEVLTSAEEGILQLYEGALGRMIPRGRELAKGIYASIRGTISGFVLGLLPGMIPAVTSFLAYDIERRISKTLKSLEQDASKGLLHQRQLIMLRARLDLFR
jgi:putative tricarboxylic transport membrane protein